MRSRQRYILFAVVAVFLLMSGGAGIVTFCTDWLFFADLGYLSIFTKVLSVQVLGGIVLGLISLVFAAGNLYLVNRVQFDSLNVLLMNQIKLPIPLAGIGRVVKKLSVVVCIGFAIIGGMWGSGLWKNALLFRHAAKVGLQDPIFGKDIGFYLFQLPFLEDVKGYFGFLIFATFVMAFLGYFAKGAVLPAERTLSIDSRARKHLAILAGLFVLNIAFSFYLSQFGLLTAPHGFFHGAGYTDIYGRLFALRLLTIVTVLAAVLLAVGLVKGTWKMALAPLAAVAVVFIGGLLIYPSLLQSLKVSPNELELERPFIEHNIRYTRFGYDLDRITIRPFPVGYGLTAKDVEQNNETIKNIRLWDDAPLLRTYGQLQQIRTYYKFMDVDNDRYLINGEYRQVMLSPRELSYADLPSKSWINEKMVFTHGNGVAMGPVSRITKEGLPEFIIKDIPPVSTTNIKITKPEIYFGELSSDYVIVKTKVPEFSYPTSEGNIYTSYQGKKGVRLDSFLRKALFAARFSNAKLLLSSDITADSRILYNRKVLERVQAVAPFLLFDDDPYIVVSDEGRLFWVLDAYTYSNRVPYSQPLNKGINYIRNSAKITVDAYDGTVNFYISDPSDVIAKVYGNIFPDLFKPLSAMPQDLRRHLRYPKQLFQTQTSMFAVYHMTDPKVFYNKEDLWEIPAYGEKAMEPYYNIMKLPGEKGVSEGKEEFILLLPFRPAKRDNLAAWLAARCDEPNYGKLVAYTFPRDRLIYGPRQVVARIDQDANISQNLTLWGQKGSRVIRGSLLVVPIESSLLYVQPLYLVAEDEGGLPELRRVIVAYENEVVMEENLELGLQKLFGQRKAAAPGQQPASQVELPVGQLAKEALRNFEKAQQLQRQGDWAGYGSELKKLEQALKRLAK
jgi:uncharacterized protein